MNPYNTIVGKEYVMVKEVSTYIAKGSIVRVISRTEHEVFVQDLSPDKYRDGRWYVEYDCLGEVEKNVK